MTTRRNVFALLGISLIAGCAIDAATPPDETASTEQDIASLNGKSLNGTSLNGTSLNGAALSGTLARVNLIGAAAGGGPIGVKNGQLTGNLVGSKWVGKSSTNVAVTLRIDAVGAGSDANADLPLYTVTYQTTLGWLPLCGVDLTGPIQAVAVPGVWTTRGSDAAAYGDAGTAFTFACRGKTIAKCVELGYRPWLGTDESLDMQACVRTLRADYCGDGVPHTVDGTLLNLYDVDGIQLDTETWFPEAEWSEAGATCVSSRLHARYTLAGDEPACFAALVTPACGTGFTTSTARITDELPW